MKLLSKYNRTTLLATIIVLAISGLCYYVIINYVLIHQLDKDLKVEEQEINDFVKNNNKLPNSTKTKDQWIEFSALEKDASQNQFSSYSIFDKHKNEDYSRRQLIFSINVNGKFYQASVSKSQIETEDLVKLIFLITLGLLTLLLVTLFAVNRFLLSKLWHPFYKTLKAVKQYQFSTKNTLELGKTDIDEFKELNNSVTIMTDRIHNDYTNLKRFTENASHEMQTPLAVIYSKLDLLIQNENFDQQQTRHLQDIYTSVAKLTKLNKSLLLLTKIENNQFNKKDNVQLDELIKEKLYQFEESTLQKQLNIDVKLNPETIVSNKTMLDILVGNLLNNAIRYTDTNGTITIHLLQTQLKISNTSTIPKLDTEMLFQRFYRHAETKQEGNGLGLSIVKQICDVEGFHLVYSHLQNEHSFSVRFAQNIFK